MSSNAWIERDREVLWHPYSQHGLNLPILPVVSGDGAYLTLKDGKKILDAISSWWVNIHGHSHPEIVKAIADQAACLEHVIFSGFTHQPGVELAEALVSHPGIQDAGLKRVFYSDNGSTAVEVALKMAYQYPLNLKKRPRPKFLALNHSYHGDTLGAMAVGEPSGFHTQFRTLMPEVDFIEADDFEMLRSTLKKNGADYAAFIFEPLLQGAAGMRIYSAEFLREAVQLCREYGVLTICDEVFTGFYRTGKCFAFEHAGIRPDLVCVSKGITGGFLPLAATLATEEIFLGFVSPHIRDAFLHGHSYTANPIACAAGLASWRLLHSDACQRQIQMIVEQTQIHTQGVPDARCIGTVGAMNVQNNSNYFTSSKSAAVRPTLLNLALERGVLLRPLGNVLYSVPPYCCTKEELTRIYDTMKAVREISETSLVD